MLILPAAKHVRNTFRKTRPWLFVSLTSCSNPRPLGRAQFALKSSGGPLIPIYCYHNLNTKGPFKPPRPQHHLLLLPGSQTLKSSANETFFFSARSVRGHRPEWGRGCCEGGLTPTPRRGPRRGLLRGPSEPFQGRRKHALRGPELP